MFVRNGVTYEFHHMGIPTNEERPEERYSASFGLYTSDADSSIARIQWHRFDANSQLPTLMRSVPHPAFKVSNLEMAIEGLPVLVGPYEPIENFRVAVVDDGGIPVELIETNLSDEEVWSRARSGRQTSLYERGE